MGHAFPDFAGIRSLAPMGWRCHFRVTSGRRDDDVRMGREAVWPLFGLRLDTAMATLRCATEDDVCGLAGALPTDLELDPSLPCHTGLAEPRHRAIGELQQYWRRMGAWTAESWKIPFAVEVDGHLVGTQTLEGEAFPRLRVVDTASWLVAHARGRGVGREMRAAVLHLAFDQLGAVAAVSSAWHDNHASLGVSRSLGYVDNGYELHARGERVDRIRRMILTADRWPTVVRPAVTVAGLDDCLPLFGLA